MWCAHISHTLSHILTLSIILTPTLYHFSWTLFLIFAYSIIFRCTRSEEAKKKRREKSDDRWRKISNVVIARTPGQYVFVVAYFFRLVLIVCLVLGQKRQAATFSHLLINKNTICSSPLNEIHFVFWKRAFCFQLMRTLYQTTLELVSKVQPTTRKHGGGLVTVCYK